MGIASLPTVTTTCREAILDALEIVLQNRATLDFCVADVARSAGMDRSAVSRNFHWPELMVVGLDLRGLQILCKLVGESQANQTGRERVLLLVRHYFYFAEHYPLYFRVRCELDPVDPHLLAAYWFDPLVIKHRRYSSLFLGQLVRAYATGTTDGSIKAQVDPLRFSIQMLARANGLIRLICQLEQQYQNDLVLDTAQLKDDHFSSLQGELTNRGKVRC